MAVYLSPGVFTREVDLTQLASAIGPLRPAFVGAAQKGPINRAIIITNPQQAIDTFGEPFPASYFMYAILAFLEEGNQCYAMRIGVEADLGQDVELSSIAIDTGGAKSSGWGRIPLFTGIDFGKINFREVTSASPLSFHPALVSNNSYNDAEISGTQGATTAAIVVTGTYSGSISDSFIMVIIEPPSASDADKIDGAGFRIIRNSDDSVVASGHLDDSDFNGTSQLIDVGSGLTIQITVSSGVLDINDTFLFDVKPNNKVFSVAVEGGTNNQYTMPTADYSTINSFVTAFNALLTNEDYILTSYTLEDDVTKVPQLRSKAAGRRIQIIGTQAWALEVGVQQYTWDMPRSYLLAVDPGTFNITTQNNRVKVNVIQNTVTKTVEVSIPDGIGQTTASIADAIDAAGGLLFDSFVLKLPGGSEHVFISTTILNQFDTLSIPANFTNLKSLKFVEELDIQFPYKRSYRGFVDNRLVLPASGSVTIGVPLSCEINAVGSACASDSAYFQNIVGWLVAPSPGTWISKYTVTLEVNTSFSLTPGSYKLIVRDLNGGAVDAVENISFDKRSDRYIAKLINSDTKLGGLYGNSYVNWEERPAFLENDVNTSGFLVRFPSQFITKKFDGQANGIPLDPAFSSYLDSALIGSPAESTGLYGFQNPQSIDINLLVTPGFSTGSVIGTALQICEGRGDVLYIADAPFGLRPQQVVDWHNGMLTSDLATAINSSYGALYWSWLLVNDQFSGDRLWVPPSGHVSAVYSRTARDREQWFAPAGPRRGRILTAIDVEYSPSEGECDLLYGSGNSVNPIVKFPQDGPTIWGQRTLQRSQSDFDRVSTRMLVNYLKKNLVKLLRDFTFEPNDKYLWKQALATINPFLSDVQSRQGIVAYNTIIDETNNTPDRMNRHEFWVSVFIKPLATTEFIILSLVSIRGSGSFSAVETLAAGGIVQ